MAAELWLKYIDENGIAKRVLVEKENFTIGRTPDNDLQIAELNLSRQHAKIERNEDAFLVSDCGSSNGSTLNGEKLEKPVALKNGDKLSLGDVVEIKIELISDEPVSEEKAEKVEAPKASAGASSPASSGGSSALIGCLIAVPVFGLIALLVVGAIFMLSGGKKDSDIGGKTKDPIYTSNNDKGDDDDDLTGNKKDSTPEKTETPTPSPTPTTANTTSTPSGGTTTPPGGTSTPPPSTPTTSTPPPSSDTAKIEMNSSQALRKIAQNDPKAFLTTKQVAILSGKVSQFKGSSGLAENIKNAKKNAEEIGKMAREKNLKPQFLAIAAISKLGSQSGDVVATARGLLDVLDNLSISVGNEGANDCLLVIAAYEQGAAGKNLEMRDLLARECLPEKNPGVSCREIRTIWFLKDKGKISDSQFESALRFLAVATIAQNPKDFNVQTEPLALN